MVLQVEVLATESEELGYIPGTYGVEINKPLCKLSTGLYVYPPPHTPPVSTYTQKMKCNKIIQSYCSVFGKKW